MCLLRPLTWRNKVLRKMFRWSSEGDVLFPLSRLEEEPAWSLPSPFCLTALIRLYPIGVWNTSENDWSNQIPLRNSDWLKVMQSLISTFWILPLVTDIGSNWGGMWDWCVKWNRMVNAAIRLVPPGWRLLVVPPVADPRIHYETRPQALTVNVIYFSLFHSSSLRDVLFHPLAFFVGFFLTFTTPREILRNICCMAIVLWLF